MVGRGRPADHESLLNLRLVCQSLSDVCRKRLFQYTCVVPTDESCERFESILDHPELASRVTKVYLDTTQWEFSQDELDQALSAVIRNPASSPGLVQALLSLGAKVNYIDTADKKTVLTRPPTLLYVPRA